MKISGTKAVYYSTEGLGRAYGWDRTPLTADY